MLRESISGSNMEDYIKTKVKIIHEKEKMTRETISKLHKDGCLYKRNGIFI